jgi:hypothetical protein
MQKVPRRKQFPYLEKEYEMPESSAQIMAEEDYETIRELSKNKDKTKLRDFINKRLATQENISNI